MSGIDHLHVLERQAQVRGPLADELCIAQQDGAAESLRAGLYGCLQHIVCIAFSEYHPHGLAAGHIGEAADELVVVAHHFLQVLLVFVPVGDGPPGHSGAHGGLGHSRGYCREQPGIQRFGQDVVASVADVLLDVVGGIDDRGDRLLGQCGYGVDCGQLHLLVDGFRAYVKGSAEDVGESEDVVDLVGIVRAAGGEYQVIAGGHRLGILYLGVGIGQGKYDRAVGHRADHLLGQDVAYGKAQEDVGADKGFGQGVHVAVSGEGPLHGVEVGAGSGDDSLAVAHYDVLAAHTELDVEVGAGDGGGTGSVDHQPDVLYLLVLQLQGVKQACG